MPKKIVTLFFLLFSICSFAQKVNYIDMFNWTDINSIGYNAMVIYYDDEKSAVVRVKFDNKMVQFNASYNIKDFETKGGSSLVVDGQSPVKSIVGKADNYSPDNFVFSLDAAGDYQMGYVIDDNILDGLTDDQDALDYSTKLESANLKTADQIRAVINKYFSPKDAIYNDLIAYINSL